MTNTNDSGLTGATTRRGFLGAALGAALAPRALASFPGAPAAGEKFLVIVNLRGGCDGLNLAIPMRRVNYYRRRPSLGILPGQAISLNTGPAPNDEYGLHPSFLRLGQLYADGQLALANLVGYPQPDLSHAESTEIWARGLRTLPANARESGWIARYKDRYAREELSVVGLGTGRTLDFQGGESSPLVLGQLGSLGFAQDPRYGTNSRFRNQVIRDVIANYQPAGATIDVKAALEQAYGQIERVNQVVQNYRSTVTYPQTGLAQRLREVAMLTQADVGVRVYYAATGGYDTHANQGGVQGQQAGLFVTLDRALGALADDLKAVGAWNRCVVAVISEFGRRNDENGSLGTDHGSSNVVLVLGGLVRGGVYGRPHTEDDLDLAHTPYEIDFRSIYKELLGKHLGVDPDPLFPEAYPRNATLGLLP